MINKKILKNTLMLYFRQLLLLFVSLYTVRVILDTLGVEDYGLYSVVAGIVTLCSFLTTSMASATQRFFSFAIGKGERKQLNNTFSVNIVIYMVIALVAFMLLESLGLWFVENHLNIPSDRFESAIKLYHYSALTFIFTVITAPFIAIIIAHEDMQYFALLSIVEAILKLIVVMLLTFIDGAKLEIYGFLLLIVSLITVLSYSAICFKKYEECQVKTFHWDKSLLKSIFKFTGWSIFGQLTTVTRVQAVTILINQFFNPTTAAARAIAITIASQINIFSNNFNTGLYPSIVKSYANNEKLILFSLILNGSKLTFFLMWAIALPVLIEIETILGVWLNEIPVETILFSRLAIIESLLFSLSMPLATAARATGKMKTYELVLGAMQLSIFVFAYVFLEHGYPAYSVFIVAIIITFLMFLARLIIVSHLIELSKYLFIKTVFYPMLILVFYSTLMTSLVQYILPNSIFFSILNMGLSVICTITLMYFIGLDKEWRYRVKSFLTKKIRLIF